VKDDWWHDGIAAKNAKRKTKKISRKVAKAQRKTEQSAYAKPTARQAADEHGYTQMGMGEVKGEK
jgi:hypothetical protein